MRRYRFGVDVESDGLNSAWLSGQRPLCGPRDRTPCCGRYSPALQIRFALPSRVLFFSPIPRGPAGPRIRHPRIHVRARLAGPFPIVVEIIWAAPNRGGHGQATDHTGSGPGDSGSLRPGPWRRQVLSSHPLACLCQQGLGQHDAGRQFVVGCPLPWNCFLHFRISASASAA